MDYLVNRLNYYINRFKRNFTNLKTGIATCVYIIVFIFLWSSYTFGLDNRFGLDEVAFIKVDENEFSNTYNYSEDVDEIEELNLFWHSGDIRINYSDTEKLTVIEKTMGQIEAYNRANVVNDGGTISVYWDRSENILDDYITLPTSPSEFQKMLIVNIPKTADISELNIRAVTSDVSISSAELSNFNCSISTGEVDIRDIITRNINLDLDNGELFLTNVMASSCDINSDKASQTIMQSTFTEFKSKSLSGAINIDSDIYTADVTSVSAEIDFVSRVEVDNLRISTVSSDVNIFIPDSSGFVFEKNVALGELISDEFAFEELGGTLYYKDSRSENTYNLATSTGIINLEKIQKGYAGTSYEQWLNDKEAQAQAELEAQQAEAEATEGT